MRGLRIAGALFFLRGEALFDGDSGRIESCVAVWSGSKLSGGSKSSTLTFFLVRPVPVVLGVGAKEFAVFRRPAVFLVGLARLGAGVNSSSLSSCWTEFSTSSSSEESTTTLRRDDAAALRDGRAGDSMVAKVFGDI